MSHFHSIYNRYLLMRFRDMSGVTSLKRNDINAERCIKYKFPSLFIVLMILKRSNIYNAKFDGYWKSLFLFERI